MRVALAHDRNVWPLFPRGPAEEPDVRPGERVQRPRRSALVCARQRRQVWPTTRCAAAGTARRPRRQRQQQRDSRCFCAVQVAMEKFVWPLRGGLGFCAAERTSAAHSAPSHRRPERRRPRRLRSLAAPIRFDSCVCCSLPLAFAVSLLQATKSKCNLLLANVIPFTIPFHSILFQRPHFSTLEIHDEQNWNQHIRKIQPSVIIFISSHHLDHQATISIHSFIHLYICIVHMYIHSMHACNITITSVTNLHIACEIQDNF